MKIIAYLYSDPLLEPTPDRDLWGWDIDHVYQDLAIATVPKKGKESAARQQWQQLLEDCQAAPADYLLIRRVEELGDSVQAVGDRLAELEALNIRLIVTEQATSTMPPALADQPILKGADLQADLLKLLQQVQREQRSRRIRQGHAQNRVQALPPPGKAPYGYRRSKSRYVVDRSTAPVVKDFFEQFLLYGSLNGAVRYLAKRYGKKIAVSTGHRWLTNPVYRGDLAYQNGELVSDTHAPIISREEAAQVDRLLRRNRQMPPRTASAPRSLAGLVVCSECRSPMTVTRVSAPRHDREYLYLRPTGCTQTPKCGAIDYGAILQQTIERICEDLPRAVAGGDLPDVGTIKQGIGGAIAAKQTILAQLPPLVTSGVLDQETADLRAYKLRTEMAVLQSKLAQLPPVNLQAIAQTVSIPQFWLDLSEAERRFYFREFIRQIELIRNEETWKLKLMFIF
ncbi:recombinase family protein [Stenomitos frigidus]|uniref:Recombinase family protein n=1 Tax=Stenomitos frigidus ULC18 TaxID=2107698 RepID=A0A2T1DSY5_9CYAN|nr:recombinase family protein [Stenomitos frigidus]PSB23585.1 recombinase family protein [Stenomitos frigidus ULC18]